MTRQRSRTESSDGSAAHVLIVPIPNPYSQRTARLDPLVTTVAILGLMAAVVVVFRIIVRRPASVTATDPVGVRTVAVFLGDDAEFFRDDRPDEPFVGVRLFQTLCDGLTAVGIDVEDRGTIQNAHRAQCVVEPARFALVLEWAKPRWVASIEWVPESAAERRHLGLTAEVFAPADSPQLRHLLTALDAWLKAHPKLSAVEWYRKEQWIADDTSDASDTPINSGC